MAENGVLDFSSVFKSEKPSTKKVRLPHGVAARASARESQNEATSPKEGSNNFAEENMASLELEPDMRTDFLANALFRLGFPQLCLQPKADDEVKRMVDTLASVVESLESTKRQVTALRDDRDRKASELDRTHRTKEKLQLQLRCLQQDKAGLENKLSMTTKAAKKDRAKFERWLKEAQVKLSKMEGNQKQWHAEKNKLETQYNRLQKRMQTMQSRKGKKPAPRGIEMSKGLEAASGTGSSAPSGAELLAVRAGEASEKKRLLLADENAALRVQLEKVHNVLVARLHEASAASAQNSPPAPPAIDEEGQEGAEHGLDDDALDLGGLGEGHFGAMDAAALCTALENLTEKMKQLDEATFATETLCDGDGCIVAVEGQALPDPAEVVLRLREHLSCAKGVIREQEELLRRSLQSQSSAAGRTGAEYAAEWCEEAEELGALRNALDVRAAELDARERMVQREAERADLLRLECAVSRFDAHLSRAAEPTLDGSARSDSDAVSSPPLARGVLGVRDANARVAAPEAGAKCVRFEEPGPVERRAGSARCAV